MRWLAAILAAWLAVAAVVALGLGAVLGRTRSGRPDEPDESADWCTEVHCADPAHWTDPVITRGDLDEWGRP